MALAKGSTTTKDARLDARRTIIAESVITKRSLIQNEVGIDRNGEMAMKRFLASPKTSVSYILSPYVEMTAKAATGLRIVVPQDTTECNFRGRDKRRKGLGPAGDGKTPGFFTHCSVAVDVDTESVLGLVSAEIWTRSEGPTPDPRTQRFEEKESLRWLTCAENAGKRLKDASQIIAVGDRESDIYEVFVRKPDHVDFVIRAAQDRALEGGVRLNSVSSSWKELGEQQVFVSPKEIGDKGRIAKVKIKAGQVSIRKPGQNSSKADPEICRLYMVEAYEVDAPADVDPLMWRLLTTIPASTFDEAKEIVRFYRLRWRIEQLFRTLKKDGLDIEATQLVYGESIMKLAAFGLVASCRIMQLVDARDGSDRPATDVIKADQIEDVAKISASLDGRTERQRNLWPKGSLPWVSWVAARLGGWNCYYRKPGPKRMARGWRRLEDMLEGMAVARQAG